MLVVTVADDAVFSAAASIDGRERRLALMNGLLSESWQKVVGDTRGFAWLVFLMPLLATTVFLGLDQLLRRLLPKPEPGAFSLNDISTFFFNDPYSFPPFLALCVLMFFFIGRLSFVDGAARFFVIVIYAIPLAIWYFAFSSLLGVRVIFMARINIAWSKFPSCIPEGTTSARITELPLEVRSSERLRAAPLSRLNPHSAVLRHEELAGALREQALLIYLPGRAD